MQFSTSPSSRVVYSILALVLPLLLGSCSGCGKGGGGGAAGGTLPGGFLLVSPAAGATGVSQAPMFSWTDAAGETSYMVQVDTDASFAAPLVFEATAIPADVTTFSMPPGILQPGATYFWRVLAVNSSGSVAASNGPWTLTTEAWAKTYGTSGEDAGYSVEPTADGGIVVAGYANLSGGSGDADFWVLKLSSAGAVVWERAYGSTQFEKAKAIRRTPGGGYVVVGTISPINGFGSDDILVLWIDATGNIVLKKRLGGGSEDYAEAVAVAPDGSVVVAGYTASAGAGGYDALVVKFNPDGTTAWQKTYGSAGNDAAFSIQSTADGGYVFSGYTSSGAGVVKLDSSGGITWQKAYVSTPTGAFTRIVEIPGDGYACAGPFSGAGGNDFVLLRLNGDGSIRWQKIINAAGDDILESFTPTSDGGFALAGQTTSYGGSSYNGWILKVDGGGALVWQKFFGGNSGDGIKSIVEAPGGSLYAVGYTGSFSLGGDWDLWVLGFGPGGLLPPIFSDSSATVSDLSLTASDTNVTSSTSSLTVTDPTLSVTVTTAVVQTQAP